MTRPTGRRPAWCCGWAAAGGWTWTCSPPRPRGRRPRGPDLVAQARFTYVPRAGAWPQPAWLRRLPVSTLALMLVLLLVLLLQVYLATPPGAAPPAVPTAVVPGVAPRVPAVTVQ